MGSGGVAIAALPTVICLKVPFSDGRGGGICYFSYSLDGRKYTSAGVPFTARQGKWIGAKVGLFSTAPYGKERGWVDADWFRINK